MSDIQQLELVVQDMEREILTLELEAQAFDVTDKWQETKSKVEATRKLLDDVKRSLTLLMLYQAKEQR